MLGEEYNACTLCNFLHSRVISSLLALNTLLKTFPSLWIFLSRRYSPAVNYRQDENSCGIAFDNFLEISRVIFKSKIQ